MSGNSPIFSLTLTLNDLMETGNERYYILVWPCYILWVFRNQDNHEPLTGPCMAEAEINTQTFMTMTLVMMPE